MNVFDSQVLAFAVVAAFMTMLPGADTLLVVRNALRGGRREGFLTNLLNPKVIVFYLALLPQFIDADDAVLAKSLLFAAIHFVEGLLWLGGVAWLVDRSRRFFLKPALRRWLDAVCGTFLTALGIRLALQQR